VQRVFLHTLALVAACAPVLGDYRVDDDDGACSGDGCGGNGGQCYQPEVGPGHPCASCARVNCALDLEECCETRSCGSVEALIDECDVERSYAMCNGLYDESASGASASSALTACITASCEGSCWNPCPGEGC
jgi:hypothetical protein